MRVLYIGTDPSSEVAEEIRRSLGATVETVASVDGTEEAFESESEPVDCVVVDASGVEVARGVLENWKGVETRIPFVLLTDDSDEEFDETHDLRRAESRDPDDVTDVVEEAVESPRQPLVPEDEEERLRQLSKYDLDAFPMRKVLERLTRIAVETFDVETAFVGVVEEDEERIISCEGLDIETIAREETICSYTILGDTVTTVEDLGSDPRFARSMVRRETDLRSYAGVPLVTLDGHTIGTFCVLDDRVREFSDDEVELLCLFADEIMEQLQLRERLREREHEDDV